MWMKKRYILDLGGENHTAEVAHDRDGNTAVRVGDGELHDVDAAWVKNGRALSLRIDGRMRLIDMSADATRTGGLNAAYRGRYMKLTAMDELRALAQQSLDDDAGGGTIAAEIPGVVVALNVEPGQSVSAGESLLVLEAMKMQNEIAAPGDGVVEEIKVEMGRSVSAGDVLVVLAAAEGQSPKE